jgi:DNA repair exonuclease SbcCD ATPase subunit
MLRIAHISDIHFRGLKRHSEYKECSERMFEQLRENCVHAIFLGGDIVHSKVQNITPELIEILNWWFEELAKIAPTVVMLGNHDGLIYNPDRLDTITPILRSLNNPRISLFRDSGIFPAFYKDDEGKDYEVHWTIFSPFDEHKGAWDNLHKTPMNEKAINIAGFHGPVSSARTDVNWQLDSAIKPNFFDRFDFAMLGDIHRYQTLDVPGSNGYGRVVYSGSMIQQNFGEEPNKGWVLWNIKDRNNFKHELIEIPNNSPYLNIQWSEDPQTTVAKGLRSLGLKEVPPGARIRLLAPSSLNSVQGNRVREILKGLGHNAYFKIHHRLETSSEGGQSTLSDVVDAEGSVLDLYDLDTYREMYLAWLSDGGLSPATEKDLDKQNEQIERALTRLRGPLEDIKREQERATNIQWSVDRIEWDNIFAYGRGNVLDFTSENWGTIFGVFGPNGVGKSTVVAVLMYALYNSTDRGAMSNGEIINDREDWCEARVFLTVGNRKLRVTRRTEKIERTTRGSGETKVNYKTNLEVQELRGQVWVDLSGEQRRDTDKILREIIGGPEDFMAVSLSPQGGALEFVESGGSVRRNILMRLLDLMVIDELCKRIKDISAEDRTWAKRGRGVVALSEILHGLEGELERNKELLASLEFRKEKAQEELSNIQFALSKDQHERVEYLQSRLNTLEGELGKRESTAERFRAHLQKYRANLSDVTDVLAKFSEPKLERERTNLQSRIKALAEVREKVRSIQKEIAANNRTQENLEGIPCGEQFPGCPYIKDAFVARAENVNLQKVLREIGDIGDDTSLQSELREIEIALREVQDAKIRGKELEARVNETLQDYEASKNEVARVKVEIEQTQAALNELGDDIEAGKNDTLMVKTYESLKSEIKGLDENILEVRTEIGVLNHKLKTTSEEVNEAKEIEERLHHWDSLIDFLSPKGLVQMIMRKQLPVVNALISKALGDHVDFTVRLHIPEESKSLEVLLSWGDKDRAVETASGMQKLVSAIAIRAALHAITPLPKSDIFVLDEGFGALDPDNLEGCFQMLDLYRRSYRHILLISHIDTVKEAVDIPLTVGVDHRGFSNLRHE